MSLKRDVRKTIEGGSTSHAVVEANNNGFITVVVTGSGSRISNLEYIGSYAPQPGNEVLLDYSAGDKPIVRMTATQVLTALEQSRYMNDESSYLGMQPAIVDDVDQGSGLQMGGIDIGMGCTIKPNGFSFPNEPHEKGETWIQHWGTNITGWKSLVYDTGNFYGDMILYGPQYFNVELSGKYLLTLHTNLQIAGNSEGENPKGYLRARVFRDGVYGPYPIMAGVATAAGYGDYYSIDISKMIYLPAGEQIYVEFVYSGDVHSYYQSLSSNPLKWVDTDNELVFKIQLINQTTIVETPPEHPIYEGLMRNFVWGYSELGPMPEPGYEGTAKHITTFNVEVLEIEDSAFADGTYSASALGALYDNSFYYVRQLENSVDKIFQINHDGEVEKVHTTGISGYPLTFYLYAPNKIIYKTYNVVESTKRELAIYTYDFDTAQTTELFKATWEYSSPIENHWRWNTDGMGVIDYDGRIYFVQPAHFWDEFSSPLSGEIVKTRFRFFNLTEGGHFDVDLEHEDGSGMEGWLHAYFNYQPLLFGSKLVCFADFGWVNNAQRIIVVDLASRTASQKDVSSNFTDYQTLLYLRTYPNYMDRLAYTSAFRFNSAASGETGLWIYDVDLDTFTYNTGGEYGWNIQWVSDADKIYWASTADITQKMFPDYERVDSPGTVIDVNNDVPIVQMDSEDETIWSFDFAAMAIYGYDDNTGTPSVTIDLTGTAVDDIPGTGTMTVRLNLIAGEFFLIVEEEDVSNNVAIYYFIIRQG